MSKKQKVAGNVANFVDERTGLGRGLKKNLGRSSPITGHSCLVK